jgi:serine/threonine protein kinase
MPAPTSSDELLKLIHKSGVLEGPNLEAFVMQLRSAGALPAAASDLAAALVRNGLLTQFQANQFLAGRWRRFIISGKYRLLENLGAGGMGTVFLCEHIIMRRRVAIKVLPGAQANDPACLSRFHREARAAATLDHPNIVRAYDVDKDGPVHFLVMEYVDGANLQEIVKKHGPMDVLRASHYIRQAAAGLEHAHEAGVVHRDIKPSNLLVDRAGTVKILDMGLARFFYDKSDNLTRQHDSLRVFGSADYLAPEQAVDSHTVDIRADIYSLGITFYYLLAGNPPFHDGPSAQKLIWHQMRQPQPIRELRPDVPEGLAAILHRMVAKDPVQRYQTPAEVVEALAPWTQTPIPAPPEKEMPQLCPAMQATGLTENQLLQPPSTVAEPAGSGGKGEGTKPAKGSTPRAAARFYAGIPVSGSGSSAETVTAGKTFPKSGSSSSSAVLLSGQRPGSKVPVQPDHKGRWAAVMAGGALALAATALAVVMGWLPVGSSGKGQPSTASPTEPAAVAKVDSATPALSLLVPAYIYPEGAGLKHWEQLLAAAAKAPVVVIANPASGPGPKADANYAAIISRAKKAGVTVIGYLTTKYTKRPLAEARADIDKWARFYPDIQGVFLDEQASGADAVDHYVALYQEARKAIPNALVVSNPGTSCAEAYLARPAADVVCIFEDPKGYDNFKPLEWTKRYPPQRFAALVTRTVDAARMERYVGDAPHRRLGYFYVTSGDEPNPWDKLPTYWDAEVAAVRRLNP